MSISPAEALRLSRAEALARKHGSTLIHANGERADDEWTMDVQQVAALIDEAVAAKDVIIMRQRKLLDDIGHKGVDSTMGGL